MRHRNLTWVTAALAAALTAGAPALAHEGTAPHGAERLSPAELQVAQAFNEVMQDVEAGAGSGSSSGPLSPEQVTIVEPYWELRNEALLDLTGMMTPEEVYAPVEDEWDPVCQSVFDAFAEMKAALKAAVPEGQELDPTIAKALNTEQQGWIALCFDGGELVFAHNQAIATAQFLQFETAQATAVLDQLAPDVTYILTTIKDLDDALEDAQVARARINAGTTLSAEDEAALGDVEDYYNELQNLRSDVFRVHHVILSRSYAFDSFLGFAETMEKDFEEMVASAPEEILEPEDIAEEYDLWLSIYEDSTKEKFHLAMVGYAFATEEVREGTYFKMLGEPVGLTRIEGTAPLVPLYLDVLARSEPVMSAIRVWEER